MTVTQINSNLFDVTSERDETVSYVIDLKAVCCTCPDFRARRSEKALDDPQRRCKHLRQVESQPSPTALERAAQVAEKLTNEQLYQWAAQHRGEPAGCACLLELACRKRAEQQPKPITAGVLQMLEGATEAERERALSIYRS